VSGYVKANREKLKTHLFIFGMFLIGGIIGAISFKNVGYISVVPLSLSLIFIAGLQIYRDIKVILKN
jgi:NADH:ubiquinone oxidoreductase subunit 6 (subunit J)